MDGISGTGLPHPPALHPYHHRLAWVAIVQPEIVSSCPSESSLSGRPAPSPTVKVPKLPGHQVLVIDAHTDIPVRPCDGCDTGGAYDVSRDRPGRLLTEVQRPFNACGSARTQGVGLQAATVTSTPPRIMVRAPLGAVDRSPWTDLPAAGGGPTIWPRYRASSGKGAL
jgi:hypothetical protein